MEHSTFKKWAAEFVGTFWLVFGGCGSAVLAAAFPQLGIGFVGVSLAFGLTVLTGAYALGPISGGHFNPAVSIGLVVGGRFRASQLAGYVIAQVAGAIAGAGVLYLIASGAPGFDLAKVVGRSRAVSLVVAGRRHTLVDDSYNANPDSVRAAIDVLAELPAPRLLVLGDMGEVGDQGPAFHAEVGLYARERGIELLFTLGPQSVAAAQSFGEARSFGDDMAALQAAVHAALPGLGSVLVKGSRFMKMERVVEALIDNAQQQKQENSEEHTHAA